MTRNESRSVLKWFCCSLEIELVVHMGHDFIYNRNAVYSVSTITAMLPPWKSLRQFEVIICPRWPKMGEVSQII